MRYIYIISTSRQATQPVTMRKRSRSDILECVNNSELLMHLDKISQMRRSLKTPSLTSNEGPPSTDQSPTLSDGPLSTGQSRSGNSKWKSTYSASISEIESARGSANGVVEWSPPNTTRIKFASNPTWDSYVWTRM